MTDSAPTPEWEIVDFGDGDKCFPAFIVNTKNGVKIQIDGSRQFVDPNPIAKLILEGFSSNERLKAKLESKCEMHVEYGSPADVLIEKLVKERDELREKLILAATGINLCIGDENDETRIHNLKKVRKHLAEALELSRPPKESK